MLSIKKELIEKIKEILTNNNMTLSTAESATAGLLASSLGSEPGISSIYIGGVVVYSEFSKERLLKIKKKIINKYGTISKECAQQMVSNLKGILNSNIAISITGNAGPTTIENKADGLFYCGFIINNVAFIDELEIDKKLSRNEKRIQVCNYCLERIISYFKK